MFALFIVSGLGAILEGVYRVIPPEELQDPKWFYVVFAGVASIVAWSMRKAFKELRKDHPNRPMRDLVRRSKDPAKFNVVIEDATEIVGLFIVALATFLSHRLELPIIDAFGSIAIGLLMCG